MKLSILEQSFKRTGNKTHCMIIVGIKDNNGEIISSSIAKFTGIAKCCPEDTYDINIGKKLSLARAELRAFDYFDRKNNKFIEITKEAIADAEQLRGKLTKQYFHNVKYIKELISKINKSNK